jgi:hypothetical protein
VQHAGGVAVDVLLFDALRIECAELRQRLHIHGHDGLQLHQ